MNLTAVGLAVMAAVPFGPFRAATAAAATGGVRSRIVFADGEGIKTADHAGGDVRIVKRTAGTGWDDQLYGPRWSEDGTWIAFTYRYQVRIIHPDGTGERDVTNNQTVQIGRPSWTPDGRRIYYTIRDDERIRFGASNLDGSLVDPPLPRNAGFDEASPVWSPDGSKVAFSTKPEGATHFGIYIMNADGSGLRGISAGDHDEFVRDWSPDGRRLAIESSLPNELPDVVTANVDGSDRRVLRNRAGPMAYSPDGTKLLFSADWRILTMRIDGTGVKDFAPVMGGADWGPGSVDPDSPVPAPEPAATAPATATPVPPGSTADGASGTPTTAGRTSARQTTTSTARTATTVPAAVPEPPSTTTPQAEDNASLALAGSRADPEHFASGRNRTMTIHEEGGPDRRPATAASIGLLGGVSLAWFRIRRLLAMG